MKGNGPRDETVQASQGLLEAALEITSRRADTMREIKALLIANKEQEALRLLRKYLGVDGHTSVD